MSKEIWIQAYERNLDDGMSENEAIKNADNRAADIQASLLDDAMNMMKEARYTPPDKKTMSHPKE